MPLSPDRPLTLLQTSDWHVGSPLLGRGLGLTAELRQVRRSEVDAAAERAVAAAVSAGADALLVPGDLWDSESVPPEAVARVLEAFAAFAPRPVFVAPGNHDFAGDGGFYDPSVLLALGMRPWPTNVFVFRSARFETFPFPGREDASVTGRAFLSPAVETGRPLADPPPRPEAPYALLLLHGSLESYAGPDAASGAKRTAPFSREELLACGFRWAALGHHHRLQVVEGGDGRPVAAYSGSPAGRGLDETGPRRFLKVTLRPDGENAVEEIPADDRTVHDLSLDVSGLDSALLCERLSALLAATRVTGRDLVRVTLTGSRPYGASLDAAPGEGSPRPASLLVRDRSAPGGGEPPDERTAEGRFLLSLRSRLAEAPDDRSRRVVELAARLGRDALAGRALVPEPLEEF